MSAPQTDIDKQTRRHRGPLQGMFAMVLFALVLLVFLGFWAFGRGGDPEGAEVRVQSGLGVEEEVDEGGVSANNRVEEEREPGVVVEPDPTAVEVPSLIVESPQTGTEDTLNPLTGPSDTALPPDPVEELPIEGAVIEEPVDDAPVAIVPAEE